MAYHDLDNLGDKLKAAVKNQPVSVALAANNRYIHSYSNGIIDATDCYEYEGISSYSQVNHAVLIVGFGTDETTGLEYWLVKNSWSTTWGD